MPSPVGELTLVADDTRCARSRFRTERSDARTHADVDRDVIDVAAGEHPMLALAKRQLEEYFDGVAHRVRRSARARGHAVPAAGVVGAAVDPVRSDDELRRAGRRSSVIDKRARAVGAANGRNPIPIVVPCHRVVGSNGHLTGFGGGIDAKAWLLDHERLVSSRD